ncbi:hypothetical protein [Desulfosarcina alkanivorans]|uniref:hypothetical protein n=1 Tax=Desulfosarcina alkanivorans TaxID=571177 RepID=UPI0012D30F60|nr:hypothetical protein [Desulfosarcina alkanivorans]
MKRVDAMTGMAAGRLPAIPAARTVRQIPGCDRRNVQRTVVDRRPADALIRAHGGRRGRFDLITAFLGAIDGTVTDIFCGHQMKFLNVVQDFAVFQTFILRVVPSFTGFAWRRYHLILLSWQSSCHFLNLKEDGTRCNLPVDCPLDIFRISSQNEPVCHPVSHRLFSGYP